MVNDFYASVIAQQHAAELRERADRDRRAKALRQARRAQRGTGSIHGRAEKPRVRDSIRRVLRALFNLPVRRSQSAESDSDGPAPADPISAVDTEAPGETEPAAPATALAVHTPEQGSNMCSPVSRSA